MALGIFDIFKNGFTRVKNLFSQSETQEQQPPPQQPQPQPQPPQEPQPRPPQPQEPQPRPPQPPQPPQQQPPQQQREERLREQLTLQMLQQQQKQQQLRERQQLSEPKKSEEAHEELQKLKAVLLQRQQQQLEQQRQLLRDQKQRIEEKRQQLKLQEQEQQEQEQLKLQEQKQLTQTQTQKQKPQFRVSFNNVHMGPAPKAEAKAKAEDKAEDKVEESNKNENYFNENVLAPVSNFFYSFFQPADNKQTTEVENLEKKPTEQQPVETSKDEKLEQQKTKRMTAAEIREDLVSQGFVPMNEPTTKKKPTTPPLNNPLPCNEVESTNRGRRIDKKPPQRPRSINPEIPHQRPYLYPRKKPVIPTDVYAQERLDRARELAGLVLQGTLYKAEEIVTDPISFAERIGIKETQYQKELDRKEKNEKTRMDKLGNASHLKHANQQPREQTQTDEAVLGLHREATTGWGEHEKQQPQKHSSRHRPITNRTPIGLNTNQEYKEYQEERRPKPKNLLPAGNNAPTR